MTAFTATLARTPASWRSSAARAWSGLASETQVRVKVALLAFVVLLSYHYSLSSLLQTIGYDTPLAYVALVPLFAAGLAVVRRSPTVREPSIHDRQLDYIIGLPLVAAALAMTFVLPASMGEMYWVDRVDLLSLPIFVGGATVLIFGTRVAWRQKAAIAYLFLAWPWPYTSVLLGTLGGFTSLTLAGLRLVLKVIPVASAIGGTGNDGVFQVDYHGHHFPVSVVTACSGVDGMVGFLLVGLLFSVIVDGPRLRKGLWMASGLVLLWTTNLLRLLLIFWVGSVGGEHLAINVLHPVAGVVIFACGVALMVALTKPFGLRLSSVASRPPGAARGTASTTPKGGASTIFAAAGILLAVALVAGAANSKLAQYDPVANASGTPKLGSFLAQPASPAGWKATYETEYEANKPLFGQSSRWFRYVFTPSGGATNLHSSLPVTADVINSGGLSGFSEYGVTACYSFHGYTLRDLAKVDLGDGISGQALSYSGSRVSQDWSIVYWIWPVKTGSGTRYERIILYLQNTGGDSVTVDGPGAAVHGLEGALTTADPVQARLLNNRAFLVAFAREIVAGQSHQHDTSVLVAQLHPGVSGLLTSTHRTVKPWHPTAAQLVQIRLQLEAARSAGLAARH